MSPEMTIESLCTMIRGYGALYKQLGNSYDRLSNINPEKVIAHPEKFTSVMSYGEFYVYAAKMLLDARKQLDKKTHVNKVYFAMKRMAEAAANLGGSYAAYADRNHLRGIFKNDGGYYAICDGFRYIQFKEDYESLPHDTGTFKPLEELLDPMPTEEITLPSIPELKAFIASNTSRSPGGEKSLMRAYKLNDTLFVDPRYLIDMMEALPGCKAYHDGTLGPVYFKGENGAGMVLPVKPKRENQEEDEDEGGDS